ncbi:hypothetical protein BDQ12DRAFT_690748, partial [Crucibulum laeve]
MISTFPYFQLSRFGSLAADLGLSGSSYLDTYSHQSGQWEQHTISTVRLVRTQQRLLYRVRKSLIEGLSEEVCVGLRDEVELQPKSSRLQATHGSNASNSSVDLSSQQNTTSAIKNPNGDAPPGKAHLKRPADAAESAHPPKLQITESYYSVHGLASDMPSQPTPVAGSSTLSVPSQASTPHSHSIPSPHPHQMPSPNPHQVPSPHPHQVPSPNPHPIPSPNPHSMPSPHTHSVPPITSHPHPGQQPTHGHSTSPSTNNMSNGTYMYQQPQNYFPEHVQPTSTLPHYLVSPAAAAPPIPYHPHPPLKRWPNDYTVSELTDGFQAMDALIAQSPSGASMTQRTAFERVFGSRYVKSTVCRHRAVWRKAPRALREQFEAMGTDERACWGEFVRRVEGRPPGRAATSTTGSNTASVDLSPTQGVLMYHSHSGNSHATMLASLNSGENMQQQQRTEEEEEPADEPVMDSLQSTSSSSTAGMSMQNS